MIQIVEETSWTKGDPEVLFPKVWPYLEIGDLDKKVGRPGWEEEHLGTVDPRGSPRNSHRTCFQQRKPGPEQQGAEVTKFLLASP